MKNKVMKSALCLLLIVALLVSLAVPFSAAKIKIVLGDANNSGIVTVIDATMIQRRLANLSGGDSSQIDNVGDVDRNKRLESIDVTYILRFCSGMTTPYQINKPISITGDDPLSGENNISLKVWSSDEALSLTRQMCSDFIAMYPDKSITISVQSQEEGDASVRVLDDPDNAADVFSFACDQVDLLDRNRMLSPLSADEVEAVKKRDTAFSVGAASSNGRMLAYPETGENGYYLAYDKNVVSEEDAKTLEGVLKACRKAGKMFVLDAANGYYSCMFAFTGGLRPNGLNSDGGQQFNNYDEEKVIDSLEAFANLFHTYSDVFVSGSVDRVSSGLMNRTVGAGIDGTWNASTIQSNLGSRYGAAKLPTINIKGTDTQIYSMCGSKLLGINSYTRYPKTAHALANYLTNEKCQLLRAKELGWSPSNKDAIASNDVQANPGSVACLEQTNYAVPQVGIAYTFWTPMGTLGNYLVRSSSITRSAIRTKFEQAVYNMKDE